MDLFFLLDHDVCDHIINYITLDDVIIISMLNNSAPNLMYHKNINDVFVREMNNSTMTVTSNNFPGECLYTCLGATMIQNNKKIRRYVYDHQLIKTTMINSFTVVNYWLNWDVVDKKKHNDVFQKILTATIDNDDSFFFLNIFVNYMYEIKAKYVINAMNKLNMFSQFNIFWNNLFGSNYPIQTDRECAPVSTDHKKVMYFSHPILVISLIIDDRSRIKKILDHYNDSRYNNVIGLFLFGDAVIKNHTTDMCSAASMSICKYIKKQYPEFIDLVTSIKHNELIFNHGS